MLLVVSNATKSTNPGVPIVPFVHWHTVFDPGQPNASIPQMSRWAYRELLWHSLLRGVDSFVMWCCEHEMDDEIALVHQVWSESCSFSDWIQRGTPITFHVPSRQGPVVSGLRIGGTVLVRRTDFEENNSQPIEIPVASRTLSVPRSPGLCQILEL